MKKQNKEKEYCEECKKEITKKMKDNQQVIYASAEHTLTSGDMDFCDPMFGGVYCCQNCYEEQVGIKVAFKKGFQEGKKEAQQEFEKIIKESIDEYIKRELKIIKDVEKEWRDEEKENKITHFGIHYPRIYSNEYYAFTELKMFWEGLKEKLKIDKLNNHSKFNNMEEINMADKVKGKAKKKKRL